MITWFAFKSYPYAENLSPLDPSFNDILTKISINFLLGKNSKRIKVSKTVKCIWISMQNYPTPFKISQIDHEILVENAEIHRFEIQDPWIVSKRFIIYFDFIIYILN